MTGLIGLCILIVTAWLSLRYRPAERDSFLMMGLCLFCGLIVLLSGVGTLSLMSLMLSVLGVVLLGLYRGQLRTQRDGRENMREIIPLSDEDEHERESYCTAAGRNHKNIVA